MHWYHKPAARSTQPNHSTHSTQRGASKYILSLFCADLLDCNAICGSAVASSSSATCSLATASQCACANRKQLIILIKTFAAPLTHSSQAHSRHVAGGNIALHAITQLMVSRTALNGRSICALGVVASRLRVFVVRYAKHCAVAWIRN